MGLLIRVYSEPLQPEIMMDNCDIGVMRAYGNGALDGYNQCESNNPYTKDTDKNEAYNLGFEYGETLYIQDNLYN